MARSQDVPVMGAKARGRSQQRNGSPLSRVIGSYSPGRKKEVSLDRSQSKLAVRYGKGKEQSKEEKAMLARFDHRPMLTAALALATIVLVVAVVTLSTLLITSQPAANPESDSGGNPGAAAAPANRDAGERHDKLVDYPNYRP
jgi:hypothetical protein